jgi:arylsulfatase A-like enzyme
MPFNGSPGPKAISEMVRRAPKLVAGAAVVVACAALSLQPGCDKRDAGTDSESAPNIVLIIIDALRADIMGCYGFPENTSPELDELARNGVLFEKTVAQCSWTRPSIGSMITSLYPRTLGIYKEDFDILLDEHLTLAEVLKANGYRTIGITANPNINRVFNFHQGFDEYAESNVIWKWMKPEEGKRVHKEDRGANLPSCEEVFGWVLERVKVQSGGPAYIQINIMEVHSPYLVRRDYATTYRGFPVQLHPDYEERELKACVWGTLAALRQVSRDTAEFIEKLRALPGWENTLFVITSDHGQGLDNHPGVELSMLHGNILYESQLMVPLILYNAADRKRVPAGRRVPEKVRLLDLMPTLLDYAGIGAPEALRGSTLLPLVEGNGGHLLPSVFFAETSFRRAEKVAAYSDLWRYIENRDGWGGVNDLELQSAGGMENGVHTDQIELNPEEAGRLKAALQEWESRFRRVSSVQPGEAPSEEVIEQLKSLGYIK